MLIPAAGGEVLHQLHGERGGGVGAVQAFERAVAINPVRGSMDVADRAASFVEFAWLAAGQGVQPEQGAVAGGKGQEQGAQGAWGKGQRDGTASVLCWGDLALF
jgi:hypothetical protein